MADGLLQTAPRRLDAAILVVDALAPWGAGACPPAGDLRAPPAALLAAADHLAAILPERALLDFALDPALGAVPVLSRLAGALSPSGALLPLASLAVRRLGLLVTIARPDRVLAALSFAGIFPVVTLALADHAVPGPQKLAAAARTPVDAWLTTARCATKLPAQIGGAPVLILDHRLEIAALVGALGPAGKPTGTGG